MSKLWQDVLEAEDRAAGDASPAKQDASPTTSSRTKRLLKLGWTDDNTGEGNAPADKSSGGITVVAIGWDHAMHQCSTVQQRRAQKGALVAADDRALVADKTAPVATDAPPRRSSRWMTARARVLHAHVIANCKITQLHWRPDSAAPWAQFDGWHIGQVRKNRYPPPPFIRALSMSGLPQPYATSRTPVAQRTPGALQVTSENQLRGVVEDLNKTHESRPDDLNEVF